MPRAEEKFHWIIYIYNINIDIDNIYVLSGLFSYDGYYSETDRTGTVQKTIHPFRY